MRKMHAVWKDRSDAQKRVIRAARRFTRALFVGRDVDACRKNAIPLHNALLVAAGQLFYADKDVAEWKRAARKKMRRTP